MALSAAGLASAAVPALGVSPAAVGQTTADEPPQEPGITLRTFDLQQSLEALCTLKSGQTPNVDKLMPTVDWSTAGDFGLEDNFLTHAVGTLHAPVAGEYTMRLTSDDGSRLSIDGSVVVDHDGLHGESSKEATVTLTEGPHELFIEHLEAGGGQALRLEWMVPGTDSFVLVPTEALSTEAGVVRVTAPGTKYCEGSDDTAGDGLGLDAVHPSFELMDLRPEGFEPMVSGMDWTEDGDLAVLTSGSVSPVGWVEDPEPGEIFLLDNATGDTDPADITPTKVATDLFNPMGIAVIDDSIFVSERDGLIELTDPDGDGFYDDRSTLAEWPFGETFHEFAFGLLHDEESFYVNLSVAIDFGGATSNPQPASDRGTAIKIDRESGEIEYVAGGLRTPNGMVFGPDGELFAMDNQGGWLPSSKLVHVEEGRFFNHFTTPAGPFDDQPVTAPALWIPQNDIGNSPSEPVLLEEGTYTGQMLFGDVTYGGLQRAALEKVEGEYQGAVFRFSAGLEAGVNATSIGPDGSIYVGGIGEAGNWSESGKLRYGLQKLAPTDAETFDFLDMRVLEDGFELEYTQPLSDETVQKIATDAADAFQATQWRYVPTQQYGGPRVDEEKVFITDAEVSADRKKVRVTMDGLKPDRVVHLRSPRSFTDVDGRELWNTEAWYTLNEIPGYVSPADQGYHEAEESVLTGSAGIAAEHNGYSGTGFIAGIQSVGAGASFEVEVEKAGSHPVNLRYANGPHPVEGTKSMSLYVNGEKVGPWELPSTGDWKTWDVATRNVDLQKGTNTIAVRYDDGDDGNVNLDVLSMGEQSDLCTPVEPDEGYTALFDGTLASFADWSLAGAGSFGRYEDCSLRTSGGMGLLWHTAEEFDSYSLKLDWKLTKDDNGGVFLGFPDPGNDPWVAVNEGYEVQIDASDEPDRTTGAVYTFQGADEAAVEEALLPVPEWNSYDIQVDGEQIRIHLNGVLVNDFTSTDPERDLAGFIGIQNHGAGETVSYRNIQVKPLGEEEPAGEEAVLDVQVAPPIVKSGKDTRVTVRLASEAETPTGAVEATLGDQTVSADVVRGRAVLIVPTDDLAAGSHDIAVEYLGDETHAAGSATGEVTVR
ncbi:family 16 glycoside hydrolase [Zhihengliuella salsuginis]|uniref:DUF1080 domain-containing protein n=1 Tax=Zhihengliuella salsuginis TaxID=578222 RepID=A0ABQ3GG85_9MICC|nr:family 16 glycoside hydrolase [Zhihengliuella salsuginis]GHD03387.1 hypothetical protein GCM10008096_09600 [Zhihengliuella salsuginis]